jgi:hypothetical protein
MDKKIINVMDYVSEEEKQKQFPDITEAMQKAIDEANKALKE